MTRRVCEPRRTPQRVSAQAVLSEAKDERAQPASNLSGRANQNLTCNPIDALCPITAL
jgi:hypothetical protein